MAEALRNIDQIDRATCRKAVEGYFSTERMIADHLQLFTELIG